MLIDYFNEQIADHVYSDGYRHSQSLAPVKRRLAGAEVYELDRDTSAMAAYVSLSKPTSIVAALPFVRLPAPRVWIEFENQHLREAMVSLGSPNLRTRSEMPTTVERAGFLLSETSTGFEVEYVHRDRVEKTGARMADMTAALWRFDLSSSGRPEIVAAVAPPVAGLYGAQGRMREYLSLLAKDEEEFVANASLHERLTWERHPDMARVFANFDALAGIEKTDRIVRDNVRQAEMLFFLQILPALILLNCRNAVSIDAEQAPERLNRSRVKKGKPPLRDRYVVRLKLTAGQRRVAEAGGAGGRERVRASIVVGHFKVRRTGIFWWSMHARGGWGVPAARVHKIVG